MKERKDITNQPTNISEEEEKEGRKEGKKGKKGMEEERSVDAKRNEWNGGGEEKNVNGRRCVEIYNAV